MAKILEDLRKDEKEKAQIAKYEKDRKIYNLSAIILSLLDIIFGFLSLFYKSMLTTAVLASVASFSVITNRYIQFKKVRKLLFSMRLVNGASKWVEEVEKMKGGGKMKKFLNALKNNPKTIIFSIICGAGLGYVGYNECAERFSLPTYANILIAIGVALVTVLIIFYLSWKSPKLALLAKAKKVLTNENFSKLVQTTDILVQDQDDELALEQLKKQQQAELEKNKLEEQVLALQIQQLAGLQEKYKKAVAAVKVSEEKLILNSTTTTTQPTATEDKTNIIF